MCITRPTGRTIIEYQRKVNSMAARLTDKQKKKIIADYIQLESYNAAAKINGVSPNTVKNLVTGNADIAQKCELKKEQNTADILDYMERQKSGICEILDICLNELKNPEKYVKAPPQQIATTMAILIDKYTADYGKAADTQSTEYDALTASLKELAGELKQGRKGQ